MRLSNGGCSLVVTMSHWLDPLPDMLAWLEAIVIGVQHCEFRVDEEGRFTDFSAKLEFCTSGKSRAYTDLHVLQENATLPLQVTLPKFELVGIFYRAFREFVESSEYVRGNWELITVEDVVIEQLGVTAAAWIDSVITLEPRELQKALWRIDPSIMTNPPDFMDNFGTENELMELTGKSRVEAGGLPCFWPLPPELWGIYAKGGDQARREYLQECLSAPLQSSWGGTPWRKMRSSLIENWLVAEPPEPWPYCKKWLT